MAWISVPPKSIGFNNQFAGYEGHFTTKPEWTLGEDTPFKVNVVNGRVTEVAYDGLVYKHQNADGANIHGGNHTTADWFTFDIGQFYYVNSFGVREQALVSEVGFQGAHTITVMQPLPVPCFGGNVYVKAEYYGWTNVKEELTAGMKIQVHDGSYREVLWTGGRRVDLTEKTRPYSVKGDLFSPQHRILVSNRWAKAKWVGKKTDYRKRTEWYGHIVLAEHLPIVSMQCGHAESLLLTDRSIGAFDDETQGELRELLKRFPKAGVKRLDSWTKDEAKALLW